MKIETKGIDEAKKEIAKRLRWSNKDLWSKLSAKKQNFVVEKYYHLSDIKSIGIHQILEDNRNVRLNLGIMIISVVLGILGSIVGNILFNKLYLSDSNLLDLIFVVSFVLALWYLLHSIEKLSAERLSQDKVLEFLLEPTRKSKK